MNVKFYDYSKVLQSDAKYSLKSQLLFSRKLILLSGLGNGQVKHAAKSFRLTKEEKNVKERPKK